MKNLKTLFILLFFSYQFCNSQELKLNKINLNLGSSFFRNIHYTHTNTPVFIASYDRRLNTDDVFFSAGLNISHQQWLINDPNQITLSDTIDQVVNRTSLGLRLLLNYRTSKRLKLFSGIRASYNIWGLLDNYKNKVEPLSPDVAAIRIGWRTLVSLLGAADFDPNIREQIAVNKFGLQVIPIAANYAFSKNFGVNVELALFGPYYFSAGISYDF